MAAAACSGGGSGGWRQHVAMVEVAVTVTAAWLWQQKHNSVVVVAAVAPAPAISCRQGEFNNQQGWEAATEGSGVGTAGRRITKYFVKLNNYSSNTTDYQTIEIFAPLEGIFAPKVQNSLPEI